MIHRIENLRWRVYDRLVPLEPLRVLAERTFLWDGARVRVAALAASHAVVVVHGASAVTELLTCGEPTDGAVAVRPGECVVVGRWTVHAALERAALAADVDGDERLEAVYPTVAGARTIIAWTIRPGSLTVKTVHTYPEEAASLVSRTEFLRGEGY